MMLTILTILIIAGTLFWLSQVMFVVSMKDEEFEGRNDKLIFFILVFFGWFIGALVFLVWKLSRQAELRSQERMAQRFKEMLPGEAAGTAGKRP